MPLKHSVEFLKTSTDNMKTVMNQPRTAYSKGKVNPRFAQFASDYGFKVRPCIAARPQTKAKVEAPMKLLDETMLITDFSIIMSSINWSIN